MRGQPRKTWKNQVEDDIRKIGLKKEDALNRSKWLKGVKMVISGMGFILNGDKTRSKLVYYYNYY